MSSEEMVFEASQAIEFANKETGEPDKTFQVFFRAPTYREMDQASVMQQHLFQAFAKMRESITEDQVEAAKAVKQSKEADDDEMGFSASEIMMLLSTHGDLRQVMRDFEKLVLKVGRFNDKTDFIERHFRGLSLPDIRRLCGEYLRFFMMPSVLAEMASST